MFHSKGSSFLQHNKFASKITKQDIILHILYSYRRSEDPHFQKEENVISKLVFCLNKSIGQIDFII